MQIQSRTVYSIGSFDFDSEDKARDYLYDRIGETMDKALSEYGAGNLGPKERIAIVDCIIKSRVKLESLLNIYNSPVEKV